MIKQTMLSLGLTNNEVEIYLTLLSSGELSVNEIGSKSGLHRQVCYDALDRLLEKGFVSCISKNNKKFFKVLSPERIIDYLETQRSVLDEKKKEVSSILPKLTSLFKTYQEETEVELVKGRNVLRTILNDILKVLKEKKETLYAMGIDESKFLEDDKIAIEQYIHRLKKNNLKEKLLAKESAGQFFSGIQSEYRLIPDESFNPNPTFIYGDKVANLIWGRPNYGIIITNKEVADSNRKHFQILWKIAKKREK